MSNIAVNLAQINTVLQDVIDPNTGKTFSAAKAIKSVTAEGGQVNVGVELGYPAKSQYAIIGDLLGGAIKALPGVVDVTVTVRSKIISHAAQRGVNLLPGVKNIIAVASGKGGVGKSTTAVNLALALSEEGARVGILDADIYGPSLPTMLGISGTPESADGKSMAPMMGHGLQANSIGFLVEQDNPMVWRGPMATQALEQLLRQTRWDDLDYLVIDLPPGTGDIQLTLSQRVPVTGSVIVTTPQDIALLDAKKGLMMFEKVGIPIFGVVENMALYHCPKCGNLEHIFGEGGGERMARDYSVDYLGGLPLDINIRLQADAGKPTVIAEPDGAVAAIYKSIARKVAIKIAEKAKDFSSKFPTITISHT